MAAYEATLSAEYDAMASTLEDARTGLEATGETVDEQATQSVATLSELATREEALEQQLWAVSRQEEELTAREAQLEQQELAFQQLNGVAESLKQIDIIQGVPYELHPRR